MKQLRSFFLKQPTEKYAKGDVLFHQDEVGRDTYYITDGFVKTYTIADDGDEKLIAILGPGDIMNLEAALFPSSTHRYYYEALTDGKLNVVPSEKLEKLITGNPPALLGLVRYLMTRNDELSQTLDNILQAKAEMKLANYLALLVQRFGIETNDGVITLPFPLSHAQLASMVGTTRETMTVQIRQLTKAGVIRPARKGLFRNRQSGLEINLAKLRELADV